MLMVEQILFCDICGKEMNRLKQSVRPSSVLQMIARGPAGVTQWHDVCCDCFGPMLDAIRAVRAEEKLEER